MSDDEIYNWTKCKIERCDSKRCIRFDSPFCMPHLVESLQGQLKRQLPALFEWLDSKSIILATETNDSEAKETYYPISDSPANLIAEFNEHQKKPFKDASEKYPGDVYMKIAKHYGLTRQEAKLIAYKYFYSAGTITLDQVMEAVGQELNGTRSTD